MYVFSVLSIPSAYPAQQAYTILESSTKSLFLHMTMSEPPAPYWGTILKSNSNGTYLGVSIENVNRNNAGYVDFEKMVGLDGIALINIVANPDEAIHSKSKQLQSRITHNDGTIRVIYKFITVTECRYRWNMDASASSQDGFSRSAICLPRNCKFPRPLQRLFWGLTVIV